MITHDLRAPLTNLSTFLELIRSGFYQQSDPLFDDRLGQLIPELARINRLLDELLMANNVETIPDKPKLQAINSLRLIDASINSVRHCARAKNISIVKECVRVSVDADFDRITRVIINLLQNAIKFSPENSTILIGTKIKGNSLHISVLDEGPGIAPQEQKCIFQPYVQGETGAGNAGVGLGLTIAQTFVHEHGGCIGVKQIEGARGSHFWFSLPLHAVQDFSVIGSS